MTVDKATGEEQLLLYEASAYLEGHRSERQRYVQCKSSIGQSGLWNNALSVLCSLDTSSECSAKLAVTISFSVWWAFMPYVFMLSVMFWQSCSDYLHATTNDYTTSGDSDDQLTGCN